MVKLKLPWPPSTNKTWRRAGKHMHLATKAATYRLAVRSLVLGAKLPGLPLTGALELHVVLYPPDRRV